MKKLWKWYMLALFLTILALFNAAEVVYAGDGNYNDGSPDKINLSVIFDFDVTPNFNPNTTWESAFIRASQLLYNATDGQVQLGKIIFYNNCPQIFDRADIVISPGIRGARANVNGLGVNGNHLYVSDGIHTRNVSSVQGHFGIVHEMGHYVFGLYDEYLDSNGNRGASCISPTSTIASIMDGGTTVSPNNQRTEFALPADQVACINTEQFAKRNMVDWPWIVQNVQNQYGARLTVPLTYTVNIPTGHQALSFEYRECKVRSVVSLDRSGSMSGNKIDIARQGAELLVNLTAATDELGVSSFSDNATINYAINVMTDTNKAAAHSVIHTISASGSTNIGGGLQISLDMITGQGKAVSNEVVILLSDGQHNTGTDPNTVIPLLKARGVQVYTIGLGSDADASLLSNIANSTGGTYFFAASAAGLPAYFNRILSQLRNDGLITALNEAVNVGETNTHLVNIDTYSAAGGESTFVLVWTNGNPNFAISRPNGTHVQPNDLDVLQHIRDTTSELFKIKNPMVGDWTVQIVGSEAPSQYDFQVNSSAASKVSVASTTDKGSYMLGNTVLVQVSVAAPPINQTATEPVKGAEVTADIQLNDEIVGELPLFDDGNPTHGDAKGNDGIYTNLYTPPTIGNYIFDIQVINKNGTNTEPEDLDNWTPEAVSPFTRQTQVTVFVQQIPDTSVTLPVVLGWQLISFPITPNPTNLATAFQSIRGDYTAVLSFEREARSFFPDTPEFNTLHNIDGTHGYWLYMTKAGQLVLTGQSTPLSASLPLKQGWNLISYLPQNTTTISNALTSIAGSYTTVLSYDQGATSFYLSIPPQLNTLQTMERGKGYWVYMTKPDVLDYSKSTVPLINNAAVQVMNRPQSTAGIAATNEWLNIYSTNSTYNGRPLPFGAVVTAVGEDGRPLGAVTVRENGWYGVLAVYRDDAYTSELDGARTGERISFLINGQPATITNGATPTWTANGDLMQVDLTGSGPEMDKFFYLPLVQR